MSNIAVLVDVSNIYYVLRKTHKGRKLSYERLLDYCNGLGKIVESRAYGASIGEEASGFIKAIEALGFKTLFKEPKVFKTPNGEKRKADWDVGIAIDMVRFALHEPGYPEVDKLILVSADGDMKDAIIFCESKGLPVIVIGSGISSDLREAATDCIEIPKSFLETPKRRKETPSNETLPQTERQ